MDFSDFGPKSAIFRFCMGGIPPPNRAQSRYFGKITTKMKRSRAVRIQNIKFCNFPISMKKVMTRSWWTKKNVFKVQNQARPFKDCADFQIGCFVPVDPSLEGRKYICAYYSRSKIGSMTQLVSLGGGKPPISQGQHR